MMYRWPLITHKVFMWAKLTFLKVVLCYFSLMEQPFLKKFFSRTCTLGGKNWCTIGLWWLIFMLCEWNWCFLSSLLFVFTNGTTFLKKFFSRRFFLRPFSLGYICYVSKINVILECFVSVFTKGSTFMALKIDGRDQQLFPVFSKVNH